LLTATAVIYCAFPKFVCTIITYAIALSVGKELRERFTGAVEAFSRRNPSPRAEHSKHRNYEDAAAVHKDAVKIVFFNKIM
jgi:hypothetical protein